MPVCTARPPDDKQPCTEDFFLSTARVPVWLPARSASWDAERLSDAQGGEAELTGELMHVELHWDAMVTRTSTLTLNRVLLTRTSTLTLNRVLWSLPSTGPT